jgi:hypothetical protein
MWNNRSRTQTSFWRYHHLLILMVASSACPLGFVNHPRDHMSAHNVLRMVSRQMAGCGQWGWSHRCYSNSSVKGNISVSSLWFYNSILIFLHLSSYISHTPHKLPPTAPTRLTPSPLSPSQPTWRHPPPPSPPSSALSDYAQPPPSTGSDSAQISSAMAYGGPDEGARLRVCWRFKTCSSSPQTYEWLGAFSLRKVLPRFVNPRIGRKPLRFSI